MAGMAQCPGCRRPMRFESGGWWYCPACRERVYVPDSVYPFAGWKAAAGPAIAGGV